MSFEQQRVDLGLLVSGVLGAVAGGELVPPGGCLLLVLGGLVPGLVAACHQRSASARVMAPAGLPVSLG